MSHAAPFLSLLRRLGYCLLLGALMAGGLAGCVSQRTLPYLQSAGYSTRAAVAVPNARVAYRLQPADVLSIRVQSVQPVLNDMFNITDPRTVTAGGDPSNLFLSGYSLDSEGFINLPTVGRVKVAGLTVEEAQTQIQQQVGKFVRDANVLVKLLSFKITVLGEVRNPGRYYLYNAHATLLEGLGLAGDLTEFGNRQNVKLIRQTPTGSEVVLLNLTDPALLASPYFNLLPNDALYVEPVAARASRANANNLGIVFAGISAVVLVLNYVKLL